MKIDRKIRVFISSKCGGLYTVARKALQAMLEESGFCEVYAFETDYSLSMPVVSAYLNELAESDVIIVFIENKDSVTDPVQSEINRARELQKKMIFIFCDEYQREPTILQEQLKEGLYEKYSICHEFSDFPLEAYNSFFNDLSKQYRFFSTSSDDIKADNDVIKEYNSETIFQIRKDTFNNIHSVRNIFKNMSGICFYNDATYEGIDHELGNLLLVLIGQKQLSEVDIDVIGKYWLDLYSEDLHEVINCRKRAFISFLNGEYQQALNILVDIVNKYGEDIPRWMKNDIAIDIRYIDSFILNRKGEWRKNLKGQAILEEDSNCLFNPILDRVNGKFYQKIVDNELSSKIESPETVNLGTDEQLFDDLSNTFIAAVNCLSITHFSLVRKRMITMYSLLSFEYRVHSLYITVVKMLILERDEKNLKRYINKYGESSRHMSADDIREIQKVIDAEKDQLKKIQSQSLLFEFFAYYYDDELFSCTVAKYFEDVERTINSGEAIAFQYILNALPEMERRVPLNKIFEVLYLFIDNEYDIWHDTVFSIITKLNTIKQLKEDDRNKLVKLVEKCLLDDKYRKNCPTLLDAAQTVRLSLGDDATVLDDIIKDVAPTYYERPYSVNVFKHTTDETSEHLKWLVKSIKKQNATQGVGGVYSAYAYNDFITIGNILFKENVDYKIVKPIVNVIEETLKTKTQTCEAKFSALRLLITIQLLFPRRRDAKQVLEKIDSSEDIKGSDTLSFQNRYSLQSIRIMFKVARMYILADEEDSFISDFCSCTEAEQIALLDTFCFFSRVDNNTEKEKLFKKIWSILLLLEVSESEKIRFLVSVVYANLYETQICDKALNRLISMLDDGSSDMKIGAISRLKAKNASGTLVDYIYQQGRVDNNYCVREIANR